MEDKEQKKYYEKIKTAFTELKFSKLKDSSPRYIHLEKKFTYKDKPYIIKIDIDVDWWGKEIQNAGVRITSVTNYDGYNREKAFRNHINSYPVGKELKELILDATEKAQHRTFKLIDSNQTVKKFGTVRKQANWELLKSLDLNIHNEDIYESNELYLQGGNNLWMIPHSEKGCIKFEIFKYKINKKDAERILTELNFDISSYFRLGRKSEKIEFIVKDEGDHCVVTYKAFLNPIEFVKTVNLFATLGIKELVRYII